MCYESFDYMGGRVLHIGIFDRSGPVPPVPSVLVPLVLLYKV